MSEFLLRNASTADGDRVDIEIQNGFIESILDAGEGDPAQFATENQYNADGRLVSPPLIEPHTHLDAALVSGILRWNESNTLEEGWRLWQDIRESATKEEVKTRAKKNIDWFVTNGVTRIRTHVDTSPDDQLFVEALLELRDELADTVEIEIVGFPLDSIVTDESNLNSLREAIELGVDLVGGIPHKALTRENGVKEVRTVVDLADRYDVGLDLHIDETDDPNSRFTGVLVDEVDRRNIGERTTASHVTALHSYPHPYADKLIRRISESGVSVITNPQSNAVLQGRYDDFPRRRGHTRIRQLRAAGVDVAIGSDDIMDTVHPYGDGDPLSAVFVLIHFAHMNGYQDIEPLWNMLLKENASVYGLNKEEYGLEEGNEGSFVVYDAPDPYNVFRIRPPRTLVVKDGKVLATTKRESTVYHGESEKRVNFTHTFN